MGLHTESAGRILARQSTSGTGELPTIHAGSGRSDDAMSAGALSILVIDGDKAASDRLGRKLKAMGHRLVFHPDAATALAECRQGGHDVVFCELLTPGLDAAALVRQLRVDGVRSPFLMMTSDPEVDDVVTAFRAGATDFLRKPIGLQDLHDALDRIARLQAAEAQPPAAGIIGYSELEERRKRILEYVGENRLQFPVAPKLVARLSRLLEEHDPEPELVFRLLEADASLGNAVMQVACSPEFRGQHPPHTTREAATRLGSRRALASAASVVHRNNYDAENGPVGGFASQLWLVHYVSSVIAELLAKLINLQHPEQLQMMTLFAQLGELASVRVAATLWPEGLVGGEPQSWMRRLVRKTWIEASAALVKKWGLSPALVRFIEAHEDVEAAPRNLQALVQISIGARALAERVLARNPFALPDDEPAEPPKLLSLIDPTALTEVAQRAVARARYVLEVQG